MSFICEECNKPQPAGQKQNEIIIEKRDKTYETVKKGNRNRPTTTQISKGWETVKRKKVCPECFKKITGEKPFAPVTVKPEPEKIVRPHFQERSRRDTFRPDKSRQVRKAPVVEVVNKLSTKK